MAGALVVAGVVLIVVLPVVVITLTAAQQAEDAFSDLRTTFQSRGLSGVIAELPPPLPALAEQIIEHLPKPPLGGTNAARLDAAADFHHGRYQRAGTVRLLKANGKPRR